MVVNQAVNENDKIHCNMSAGQYNRGRTWRVSVINVCDYFRSNFPLINGGEGFGVRELGIVVCVCVCVCGGGGGGGGGALFPHLHIYVI